MCFGTAVLVSAHQHSHVLQWLCVALMTASLARLKLVSASLQRLDKVLDSDEHQARVLETLISCGADVNCKSKLVSPNGENDWMRLQ